MERRVLVLLIRELEALLPLAIQPSTRAVLVGAMVEAKRIVLEIDEREHPLYPVFMIVQ